MCVILYLCAHQIMNSISTTIGALFFMYFACTEVFGAKSKHLMNLNDENWRDMLEGEWMINFFSKATWCPACKELERPWNAFADWSSLKNKKIKVAQVDVTENPGLSGRFLVSALPTIFHVKDGVFRLYGGPKDKEDFVKFIKQKQWSTVEPMASWFHPDSTQ
uniref:Thioredoxin domain-containing protein n=1 Tax=Romanomermis culicivorax TaxID=13658 RepID=A0A915K9M6_ROMCU